MAVEKNVSYEIRRLVTRLRRLQATRPAPELARQEFVALHMLRMMCEDRAEGVTVGELAEELDISHPATSKCLGTLEDRGLTVRARDRANRRNVLVRLTKAGMELEATVAAANAVVTQRVFERLGEKDTEEFLRISTRLLQIAEEEQKKEDIKTDD